MTDDMGEIRIPAGLLEFDSGGGGSGFPLVKVEDVFGVLHEGRFVGRRTGTDGLRLELASLSGEQRWVHCDPDREVIVFPGR